MSSIMNSQTVASNFPAAFSSSSMLPSLATLTHPRHRPHPFPLPPLAVTIATTSSSPLCVQSKKHRGSSRMARAILRADKNKDDRKSRIVFDFTEVEMAKYYHLPQRVAAKRLGVAVITIKRNCKRRGIKWPYRADRLREIQEAKTKKPLQRASRSQKATAHTRGMTPMMMLSEAARAFSRLPIDCMGDEPAAIPAASTHG